MADEKKYQSLASMTAKDYTGPTTKYFGSASGTEAKLAMLKFLNGNNETLDKQIGNYIALAGWVVKVADFQQDTGESRRGLLVGLIMADGTFLQTTSATIAQTLDSFADILGAPPYAEPVWCQIIEIVTRKKRKTQQIMAVDLKDIPQGALIFTANGAVPYDKKPAKK